MARYDYTIARIAVALVILALLVAGCGATPAQPGVHVQLEHGPLPPVGGVLTVRAIVDSVIDGPDSEIIFLSACGCTRHEWAGTAKSAYSKKHNTDL